MTLGCAPTTLCCGPFVAGERPDPLVYTFLDANGAPLDLTGFTGSFCWAERWGGAQAAVLVVSDPTGGQVTHSWPGPVTAGQWTGLFWVTHADGRRYASLPIRFDVHVPACAVVAA